jgi:16S rRNA (uracil1498-N3)-methyltransferase
MRTSRIYTSQPLLSVNSVKLTGPVSHYLLRVLRLSEGDSITLFNGDGRDYSGEICEVRCQAVLVRITGSGVPGTESPLKITLVQAISRGERMDYSLQKATELGVFCVQPVTSRRVEVRLDKKRQAKRLTHWQSVVISASEQSGRAIVPEVKTPLSLQEWIAIDDGSPGLVLDPTSEVKLSSFPVTGDSVSVIVGPEGGFTSEELNELKAGGVKAVSLGPRVLRTETAGPAAIVVLQSAAGDY